MALYPAVIREYDAPRRKVRIEMVGMTDGDTLLPEADLMYALGDKSTHTEIEILAGDTVWVDFLADDPRYPIIMGYRNPETGNSVEWRKWHHANIELSADGKMVLKGKSLKMEFATIEITGKTTHNSPVTNKALVSMNSGINNGNGGAVAVSGGLDVNGGDVSADGLSLKYHVHSGVESGDDETGSAK